MCMLQVKFHFWLILIQPRLVLILFCLLATGDKGIRGFKVTPLSFDPSPPAEVRIPRRNAAHAHFAVTNKGARQFYLRSDTR